MFQLRSIFIFAASAAMLSGMTARADGHREWTAQQAADSRPQQWAMKKNIRHATERVYFLISSISCLRITRLSSCTISDLN